MVASLRAAGGTHSLDDFGATQSTYAPPISGDYKSVTLTEHPPNGQGATAILLLNILSHFDLAAMDPYGTARAHIEAEAAKLAYDARNRFIALQQINLSCSFILWLMAMNSDQDFQTVHPKAQHQDAPSRQQRFQPF